MNKSDDDPIMGEVYEIRREISSRFGNDPDRYIASIREMKRRASEAGLSFLEYCRSVSGDKAFLPVQFAYPSPAFTTEDTGVLCACESTD
jgi:hypothetical protein